MALAVTLVLTADRRPATPPPALAVPEPPVAEQPPPAPPRVEIATEAELGRGETLVGSLSRNGVDGYVAHLIDTGMAPVFNFRYARPGDRYRLVQNEAGEILRFDYTRSELERYVLVRDGDALLPSRYEPDLVNQRARLAGVVDHSLYDAMEGLGGEPELAHDFSDIFAWDVDFSRNVQPGDEFAMLYERVHVQDPGEGLRYVHPGRILAARYNNAQADYTAVYFETDEGRGGYYRPDGSSVQRQFLRAPLNYRRISSGYSLARMHPILKVRRPHQGIDYAADYGTPVWSVAGGVITYKGWSGGYGRMVKVRHNNGYETQYAHLSRYAKSLRVGQRVDQKQVLGFVGSTGLSTGPHLDFRIRHHGRYVNPRSLRTPAGDPIPAHAEPLFEAHRDELLQALDPEPMAVVTNEAL